MTDEELTDFTDDSAIWRISIPESILCADALMLIADSVEWAEPKLT